MPKRHFLNNHTPLSQQVAGFMGEAFGSGRHSAKDTLLITPTAGASRSIAQALKSLGSAVPTAHQPMQALLPERDDVATKVEQSLGWAEALKGAPDHELQALFWKRQPENLAERLKAGRNFQKLANLLAEAGLSASTFRLPAELAGSFDEGRWSAIATLHHSYLEQLRAWNLCDPNELRLQEVESPNPKIRHLVVAGVADLPTVFQAYFEKLEAGGASVDLLIWNPTAAHESDFDALGRPIPEIWNRREIPIQDAQLHVAASARDEAGAAIDKLLHAPSGGLVSADPKLNSVLAGAILSQQHQPYLPEGDALIRSEAAKLALGWEEFLLGQDLRQLRRLVELPAFCRALDVENPISQSDALTAIDHLLGETIAGTLESAWAASPEQPEEAKTKMRGKVRRLLGAVRARLGTSGLDLLEEAHGAEERPEPVERIVTLGRQLESSPALKKSKRIPTLVFSQAILSEQLQAPAPDGAITLNGWLEAPWLDGQTLVLCGLIEGQIPQTLDGDPFLPDSVRPTLGLSYNDMRLARDAYLLSSLLASRSADAVRLSFSKYNPDGDPNRPSRLLLRPARSALPQRVRKIAEAETSTRTRPRRQTDWKWRLPGVLPPVEKISPTQFEGYLACPLRFCLSKVLRLDYGPEASHEMNAAVFGNLIHHTLESFARAIIPTGEQMLRLGEQEIRQQVQRFLEEEALRLFGPIPAPAVRIQLANAATRLHAFARVQTECFAEGWFIIEAERKLEADAADALQIGPLKLSGVIDRVDRHAESGALRVMDYKTFSSKKPPAQTHIGPASHNWLPEAAVELNGKARTWTNLQLPLYRKILGHWYPEECVAHPPETAYFLLPSDPNESGIEVFSELNQDGLYDAAIQCAEAAARHISKAVFWPPQPFRNNWDDPLAPLLVNGAPEDSIHPDSIEVLKGAEL